jgi:hypothetical protein
VHALGVDARRLTAVMKHERPAVSRICAHPRRALAAVCLQALGTDAQRIAAVLKHELPAPACDERPVKREVVR